MSTATATATAVQKQQQPAFRTLAFYKFYPLAKDGLAEFRTQLLHDLGQLGIVGRVYISTEGINAQLSCPTQSISALRGYCERVLKPKLGGGELMDLNLGTEAAPGKASFRALHVRIRKQLVADGLDPTTYDLSHQPSHLSPSEWHKKLTNYKKTHGKDPILIDMRNHYESEIGYFEGAIRPNVDTFRGSIKAMNDICKDVPRDQEVFMYCTGGIRCSKAGAILQSQSGFKTVHLVAGGVTAYGRWIQEQQRDAKATVSQTSSLFKGRNFTFDKRLGEPITDEVLGRYHFFNPDGPVMVEGVRAYIKQGESPSCSETDRVVIGKAGVKCEHHYHRRVRPTEVLGEPGDVLKRWEEAGRELPPLVV
ncbi:Rhodanese-like domain-containing protein [Dichotomocladium elegans]|nr:Rhodanese-like domain-containing protein [Dichotomocladium elegans]